LPALYNAFAETINTPMHADFVQPKCNRLTENFMAKSNTVEFAAYVGIDWADKKHDICLQVADSAEREYLVLEHRPEAIEDWANDLRSRFDSRPVAVCLEQRKGPLIYALSKYEHLTLFPVNPQMLAKLRQAFTPSRAKDDPTDAALAVDILLLHRDRLRPWAPEDPLTRQIREMVAARRRLVEQRVRTSNRLTANLKGYFPQALECFDTLDTLMACDFLTNWPSLSSAKRARAETLTAFFHKHGVRGRELVEGRVRTLKTALPLTLDKGVVLPGTMLTRALVDQLRCLIVSIDRYDQAIDRLFKEHPDAFIFDSLPGAGSVFAPRLLVAFGSDRERYESAESIQKYSGVAPVTERSGKSCWVHWRYSCPTFIRQSMVEWAGMSIRYSFWAEAYYNGQREKGKTHNVAVRSLAFKWLRILFRCWKDRRPYDEAKYLFALKQKKSPLLQYMSRPLELAA
jgi:transposase